MSNFDKESLILNKRLNRKFILIFLAVVLATLIFVFRKDIWYIVRHIFSHEDIGDFKAFMNRKAFLGSAIIIFLQMLVVLVTVLPSEPIQITAGLAYGVVWGTILCVIGVMLGCMIVYFLVRKAKYKLRSKKSAAQQQELKKQLAKSKKSKSVIIILLYLCPGIPYGLIAFLAATIDLKWWKYLVINFFGCLCSTVFTVFFGNVLAKGNPIVSLIFAALIIVLVLVVVLNKNRLLKLIFREKKTLDEKLNVFKVRKPSRLLYFLFKSVIKKGFKAANANVKYLCDLDSIEPPFLVLFSHPSKKDYIYMSYAMRMRRMNVVLNRYFFHERMLGWFLSRVGGIPKRLFQSDVTATKNILKCIKEGRSVCLAPEGINSVSGASKEAVASTAKLIKHVNVPVLSININGAFITQPKWNPVKAKHKGRVDVVVDLLFRKGETVQLSENEILDRINEKLCFQDFKWARENKVWFEAENRATNLHQALYLCPKCKSEFETEAEGDKIWCKRCGNGAFVDNYFQLNKLNEDDVLPEDITGWYKMQQEAVSEEVQNPDFEIREPCRVVTHDESGFKEVVRYEGEVTINCEGIHFSGIDIKSGAPFEISEYRRNLPMVAIVYGKSFDFYYGDIYYEFVLHDGRKIVKCDIAVNKIYEFYEKK